MGRAQVLDKLKGIISRAESLSQIIYKFGDEPLKNRLEIVITSAKGWEKAFDDEAIGRPRFGPESAVGMIEVNLSGLEVSLRARLSSGTGANALPIQRLIPSILQPNGS